MHETQVGPTRASGEYGVGQASDHDEEAGQAVVGEPGAGVPGVDRLHAGLAAAEEKPALWPICDRHYAPFAEYRERTAREIPIFVCEPR